ncbi:MAG TPA: adenylate/guanylate cyclase domain-containing protein, partial [Candidatus Eisenbacteria bacterium]|nr:adenylate/guanylate cyclase domain-containing protein [Candidatus Eisenbacteria bacterium]
TPSAPFASPRSYTPKHLADKILTTASALEGERKQVTVLFVDVSGFTSLSERLDPEDVHGLMKRAFELMLAEVHANEGTVNQFLGDGIMALFGAPIAHEDHARRAVRAALGITRALAAYQDDLAPRGISFRARQGVNTGLVVVGSIGGDFRMDYTAVGDTTNVAARLQQAGQPGQVTISEATHRLVHGYFETRKLGQIHLKGKAEPVTAWEVIGAHDSRTRLEVESARGLTPFVGRERELRVMLDAFQRARAGAGQAIVLVGEAGIGKSRLLLELRRRVGDEAIWQEGHCVSFGGAMTFHPLVDLLRRRFAIEDSDAEAAIAAKIDEGVAQVGEDPARLAPFLRALLALDPGDDDVRAMSPAQRRTETFDALRRLLVSAAERQPQVLVIEDLHWIDSASERFLSLLLDTIPALRVLLVFTYRPGYVSPFGDRSYLTRLVPSALTIDEGARMAAAVLAAHELPAELRAVIGAKAEGNPFYVEELVKSLEESGALAGPVTELVIPGSIQDVIAARIDRLADAPKRMLQLGAVIGREFTRRLVDRLAQARDPSDDLLRELTALELILERRLYPELAYMFKHALTQDVAYESLLVQRRRELHALVGHAIEELYADRLPEHYEVLAHHFFKAEDWTRALTYLLKAAEKATLAFGMRQALTHYDHALVAVDRLQDRVPAATVIAILRARADLYFGLGDFVRSREAAERLVALARRVGDRAAEAAGLVQVANGFQWAEDFPAAHERLREAIEIAEALDAQGPLAAALYGRGYLHALNGRIDTAEVELSRALLIGRATGDAARVSMTLHVMALNRSWQGHYAESVKLAEEGVALAREHRLAIPLGRCLWNIGLASHEMGQHDRALEALGEGLALAERIGDEALIPRFLNTLGFLRLQCGDFGVGIELSERAYEITGRSSRVGHGTGAERRAFIRNNEADAFMARGDLASAAQALDESFHTVQHPPPSQWMTWRYTTHCYASLGQLALLRGDADRARRFAEQALEAATVPESRKYQAWAWRLKGESATARRAWGEAEEALRRALAIALGIAQPHQTWLGHLGLARLLEA